MDTLMTIFRLSITGSIIFVIFLLINPLTKKNFSSSWHYYVLVLTLMFFALPAGNFINIPIRAISEPFAIMEMTGPVSQDKITENMSTGNTGGVQKADNFEDVEGYINEQVPVQEMEHSLTQAENYGMDSRNRKAYNVKFLTSVIPYIWIIGMIISLLLKIIPYIKFKLAISANNKEIKDRNILGLFKLCKQGLNIKGKVSLKICQNISTPMLVGIFNPVILMPDIDGDNETLRMIFLHELNHYKRKDIIIKALGVIINAIHWFNPIIYILLNKIDIYCEHSIDERVVGEMGIEDRKYYGETILKLMDNSIAKRDVFTTAMSSDAKKLKSRLKNILFFERISKAKAVLSLLVLLLILIIGFTVACSTVPTESTDLNNPYTVYIKDDGLYFTYLNNGKEIKIHHGDSFEYPLISKLGNYIAYTKDSSLYIYDVKAEEYEKVADEINHYYISYDWVDDTNMVYSTNNSGFTLFNMLTKEGQEHLDGHYYDSFKASNNNIIYGRKSSRWTTEEREFDITNGIVEINLNEYDLDNKTFITNLIIEGKRSTDEAIGYNPVVWKVTEDGKYLYIMEKSASGSLSTDVIGIGIYDVDKKEHKEFANIDTLSYKNHLAINPKNNNIIGLIEGAGREMIENKKVILLDINGDKTYNAINFMEEDLLAMTPSFTLDGESLLYSASKKMENRPGIDSYEIWERQPHNIYQYDIKTSSVKKLTDGDNFDFMPVNISEDEILFVRYKGNDYYSLIKLVDGKENIIVDNLIFSGGKDNYPFTFYGHIQTEKAMDIFYIGW